jgi:rubrerythrin
MSDPTDADAEPTRDRPTRTRRGLLGTVATLGVAALAGCSGGSDGTDTPMAGGGGTATSTATPTPVPTETETPTETPTATPAPAPDVDVLNYALTLEHLENAFYREGLDTFADDELAGADVLSAFDGRVRMEVPDYLRTVGAHEAAHVEALSATVRDLGGTPVEEATYDFGYGTPSEFLGVARALENTGVAAYAGAAPDIVDNAILAAAAGIHSVEARHAGFLNLLNGDSPFPAAVDEADSMAEVLEVAGGFVTDSGGEMEGNSGGEMEGDSGGEMESDSGGEMGDDSGDGMEGETSPTPDRKTEDGTTDVDVLNYALTLEHLENAFYREGLETFSDRELLAADALEPFSGSFRATVPDRLRAVGAHEAAHVEALTATVQRLGGTPVEEATYDFGYGTPSEFLGVARALENTGVAAYAGAAGSVSNDDVFAAALGIHSVEARHAGFLNELTGEVPFPDGTDAPMTMSEVREVAEQFVVS